jgi:excisionase family DNA binding protein
MSIQELADFLDVPVKTIYAWRYHGEGPQGFRVGRHVRFRWCDVEAWLADRMAAEE